MNRIAIVFSSALLVVGLNNPLFAEETGTGKNNNGAQSMSTTTTAPAECSLLEYWFGLCGVETDETSGS